MAREVIIRIRDDLDGESLADTTVSFGYKGVSYEIDLTSEHDAEFDEALARFIQVARVVTPEKPARKAKQKQGSPRTLAPGSPVLEQKRRIREWGRQTGWKVQDRGMIARNIIESYSETHPEDPILRDTWSKYSKRKGRPEPVTAQHLRQVGSNGEASVTALIQPAARLGLSEEERRKVRAWAAANGYKQSRTGQIKGEVLEAYGAAHGE